MHSASDDGVIMKENHPKEITIDGVRYAPVEEPLKLSDCKDKDDFIMRLIDEAPRRDSIMSCFKNDDIGVIRIAMMEAENLANLAKMRGIDLFIQAHHTGQAYVGVSWQGHVYPEINMLKNIKQEWQKYS